MIKKKICNCQRTINHEEVVAVISFARDALEALLDYYYYYYFVSRLHAIPKGKTAKCFSRRKAPTVLITRLISQKVKHFFQKRNAFFQKSVKRSQLMDD